MKINKGLLKMLHAFPYECGADFESKKQTIASTLKEVKENGYDGVVINADFGNGYIENKENLALVEEKIKACKVLGLRVWIYDEKYYPSGAADVITLRDNPELESLALVCVPMVLGAQERRKQGVPHGHLTAMGAFGYAFSGEKVTDADLKNQIVFDWEKDGYNLVNNTFNKMLCLSFFTKYAFEGTHCQHNAATIRRYVDIGNEECGKAFVNNTYRVYCDALAQYVADGTIEAFFTDEPSYMACYFNLLKKPREVTHVHDQDIPLYAMVNWTKDLEKHFFSRYGYDLTCNLTKLFIGSSAQDRKVRKDYYNLLSERASDGYFKPISEFCEQNGTNFSGHILLEEKITDHLNYEGNFFTLLKNMQIPGMDMLDSLPEKVWQKAFTPLLVSSISKLYRDGDVLNEVSCHFQNKFSVPVSPIDAFNSLAMQYALGATLFTSYYNDKTDPVQKTLPSGQTVVNAFRKLMSETDCLSMAKVFVHYPIETIMENKVSPIDMGRVYDSTLNESILPYPINRADIGKNIKMDSIVEDCCYDKAKQVEKSMESVMFYLLNSQVPFLFADTQAIDRVISNRPKLFIVTPQTPTNELKAKIKELAVAGVKVVIMLDFDQDEAIYGKTANVQFIKEVNELFMVLSELDLIKSKGNTDGVVSAYGKKTLLVVNSTNKEKAVSYKFNARIAKEYASEKLLEIKNENGYASFILPAYGVVALEK